MFTEALKVMGIGVGVVFVMLAVFYLMIRVLMRIFPARDDGDTQKQ
ncbi:MAG: OadG family protein [Christensenellales bacterium]|jgi:Na+-transporting methylmalonyl-CoA/oxaloacetate decarboxylase gamma subunit